MRPQLVSALVWATGLVAVSASPVAGPLIAVRSPPGRDDAWTVAEIRRRLYQMVHHKRETVFNGTVSIDKSWSGATLFSK